MADVVPSDSPTTFDPCSPFPNSPQCGGGVNMCVVPDAGTQVLADGGQFGAACAPFCGASFFGSCQLVSVDAQQLVRCSTLCTGRRPAGLVEERNDGQTDLAAYLSEAAYLEAASVQAFAVLRSELRHHGAPRSIVRSAGRAARDEVRHARLMGTLARRRGATSRNPRVARRPIRALAEIAVENAVEGCVRETYGAVVALYQSRAAGDRSVRTAMREIARDEAGHAALAWRIHAWIDRRLTPAERERVAAARRAAVEEIASAVERGVPSGVKRLAGIPGPIEATDMFERMRAALWHC